ncbi:hypothetical protein PoB_006039700 [Plakobranchus ocellatus]|uniref:Centromere protein O n=1 Tax=Plakobranchus ocellatus TaxID=259542 RepID=A0AAV4CPT6_9GAST|nr:hypothetical protein PoB_006039700 [Plakobranchus ocellatus]
MNAMIALQDLRKARNTKHKHSALSDKVKDQLEHIVALKKEKAMLEERLAALSLEQNEEEEEDLDQWGDAELTERFKTLQELKEKLSAYTLIGPCGMTVSDVSSDSLTVMLNPMWQSVRESFFLSLVAKDNGMEVSGTNIPYFFNVPALAASMKADVVALMNAISLRLIAYVHRKGEVLQILKTHSDVITESSVTEPVTSVGLKLQCVDTATEIRKYMDVYITYSSVLDFRPAKVKFSSENVSIPADVEEELRHHLLTSPLSSAMPKIVDCLTTTEAVVLEPQQLRTGSVSQSE